MPLSRSLQVGLALGACASLVLAGSADAETPSKPSVIADGPSYITSMDHDGVHLYWGEEPLAAEGKGGLFRAITPNGRVEALWAGASVSNVVVTGDLVLFTTGMDKRLSAISKNGGEARLVVDTDTIAQDIGISGGGGITGLGRVEDRIVLALTPFGKCRDNAGAIVTIALDGRDLKVLTRACPAALSVDGIDLVWREWGKEKAEGGREDDTIFRMSVHDRKPIVVAKAQVYLQPVIVGGVVFYVEEAVAPDGFSGIMRAEANKKPTRFAPGVSASLSTDGVDLYAHEQPFGTKLFQYDPKTGAARLLVDRKGLTRVHALLGEAAYSVCELGKRCSLEYVGGVTLPQDFDIDLEALEREMQEP